MKKLCSPHILEDPDAMFCNAILVVRSNCSIWHRLLSWVVVGRPIFCTKDAIIGMIMCNIDVMMVGQLFECMFTFYSLFHGGGFLYPDKGKAGVLIDIDGSTGVSLCGELATHLCYESRCWRDELIDWNTFSWALWFRCLIGIHRCVRSPWLASGFVICAGGAKWKVLSFEPLR